MQSNLERAQWIFAVGMSCILLIAGCQKPTDPIATQNPVRASSPVSESIPISPAPTESQQRDCLAAAKKALGAHAKVLRCGALNSPNIQEVVAILPAYFPAKYGSGIPIRKMMILRKESSGWRVVLTAARQIQNEAGYVGLEYIDDSFHYFGYWLTFPSERPHRGRGMRIELTDIEKANGSSEASSTEIVWNPGVGRYQEWLFGDDPQKFQPEVKNPPHWKPGVKLPATSSQ